MKSNILRGLAISALVIAAPLSTAFAADMPVKATPPPASAPVNSWTGFTMDVAAGWERNSYNWNNNNDFLFPTAPFSLSSTDGVVGGHFGYQQQFGWLVVGGEVGASTSFNSKFASVTSNGLANTPCAVFVAGVTCQAAIGAVSTVGGKLGVAWQDWLFYGAGGAAYGANVKTQAVFGTAPVDLTAPQNAHGWYAGGGFDFMTIKTSLVDLLLGVEYRHIDLGTTLEFSSGDGFVSGPAQRAVGAKEDIVWAKLTVKWNPLGP